MTSHRRYFFWLSMYMLFLLGLGSCYVQAADLPPVHVIIVWTDEKSGDIEYTEHAGIASSAKRCGEMTIKEVAPHVPDFKDNQHKWEPHIVCGISQDHYIAPKQPQAEPEAEPEEEPDDPENSRPGTGGNAPSLPL